LKPVYGLAVATLVGSLLLGSTPAFSGPTASVALLDGTSHTGEVTALSQEQIQLDTESGPLTLPGNQILQLEFTGGSPVPADLKWIGVTASDLSQLQVHSIQSDGTNAALETVGLGTLSLPYRQLKDVRLAPADDKTEAAWQELQARSTRDDLLIVRKGDVLDYVAGSVGRITPEAVTMLVRNKELSAPRERLFGVIFATQNPPTGRRIAVRTQSGDVLQADTLSLKENALQVETRSLGAVTIPVDQLQSLDFGGGRVRFLTDLVYDASESAPPDPKEPVLWYISKNAPAGSGGRGVLRIGQKEYRRGLWLHSGTVLRYRLNREYTRLRTTAGFELTHVTRMPRFDPKVRLVIQGDGKELYRNDFGWNDPPVPLDLDLTEIRDLSIRVESLGAAKGILEHFGLGDAQVLR